MAAYVEHRFKRGFLLDEERFRKLNSIIQNRLSKLEPPLKHSFRVYRADSYSYETDKVDDVTKEDNPDWQRITRLQVKAEHKDSFNLDLDFSDDGTFIKMVGDDRDAVFLLFSDLREYLQNEVNTGFRFTETTRRFLAMLMPLFFIVVSPIIIMFTLKMPEVDTDKVASLVAEEDLVTKINFLLERSLITQDSIFRKGPALGFIIVMPILFILTITPLGEKVCGFLFPSNLFLFGMQNQKFLRHRHLLANIVWGVIVAFVISLVAGLLVWKMTAT